MSSFSTWYYSQPIQTERYANGFSWLQLGTSTYETISGATHLIKGIVDREDTVSLIIEASETLLSTVQLVATISYLYFSTPKRQVVDENTTILARLNTEKPASGPDRLAKPYLFTMAAIGTVETLSGIYHTIHAAKSGNIPDIFHGISKIAVGGIEALGSVYYLCIYAPTTILRERPIVELTPYSTVQEEQPIT